MNISYSRTLNYPRKFLYELVNDIQSYKNFVPYITNSQVLSSSKDTVEGELTVGFGIIHKSFSTRNHLKPYEAISMQLNEGPFTRLDGSWSFQEVQSGETLLIFELTLEFQDNLLGKIIQPIINKIANEVIDAFSKEAKRRYEQKHIQ